MKAGIIDGDQRLTTAPLMTPSNDTVTSIKMSIRLNATILMAYALSGGTAMSPEKCLQANWEEVGYIDARGLPRIALLRAPRGLRQHRRYR